MDSPGQSPTAHSRADDDPGAVEEEPDVFTGTGEQYIEQVPIVDSTFFSVSMLFIVLLNVFTIGLETDLSDMDTTSFSILNNGFLIVYLGELLLRVLTYGGASMRDKLTILDMFLVLLAFMERVVSDTSFARSLPVLRLFRALRVMRSTKKLKVSRELRVLTACASQTFKSLAWVAALLFIVLWAAATMAYVALGQSGEWEGSTNPFVDHDTFTSFDNVEYFGSVSRSFLTLVQVITLAQWSSHVARQVAIMYPLSMFFFLAFIFFTTYGIVCGVIAGIVSESMGASRETEKAQQEIYLESRARAGREVISIVDAIDNNSDGQISADELACALQIPKFRQLLSDLGVPISDPDGLIQLMDKSGDGLVSYEELRDTVVDMDSPIKPKDFTKLALRVWNLLQRAELLEQRLENIAAHVNLVCSTLKGAFHWVQHYLDTREETELQRNAKKLLREGMPALPPPPMKHIIDPNAEKQIKDSLTTGEEFIAFSVRMLSLPPQDGIKVTAHTRKKEVLPPAPWPEHGRETALRVAAEDEVKRGTYSMSRPMLRSSPNYSALKDIIG